MTEIIIGDVEEVLRSFRRNTFDAVLCDPPYGLSFMGRKWDCDVPSVDIWRAVLRVCKPGAPLIAFFGTRTYHRGVVNIEDAGFEIRDSIAWMYGQGFPKSLDVSKALDAAAGVEREVVGHRDTAVGNGGTGNNFLTKNSRSRIVPVTRATTDAAREWHGYGTALKPAYEPGVLARKPLDGTVAENVAKWGTGALAIDACRIEGAKPSTTRGASAQRRSLGVLHAQGRIEDDGLGRWPANVILDEEAGAALDAQSGIRVSGSRRSGVGKGLGYMSSARGDGGPAIAGSCGGASRFFYCAKASNAERGQGNTHPTVKPLALCEYLARLILPPKAKRILVPFAGSGSEMIGALRAGWPDVVGIERERAYVKIARRRIAAHIEASVSRRAA